MTGPVCHLVALGGGGGWFRGVCTGVDVQPDAAVSPSGSATGYMCSAGLTRCRLDLTIMKQCKFLVIAAAAARWPL